MASKEDTDDLESKVWRSADPRHEIPARATIVILRPDGHWDAGVAYVETDHGYYLQYSSGGVLISEDDTWPEGWVWTFAPERT